MLRGLDVFVVVSISVCVHVGPARGQVSKDVQSRSNEVVLPIDELVLRCHR